MSFQNITLVQGDGATNGHDDQNASQTLNPNLNSPPVNGTVLLMGVAVRDVNFTAVVSTIAQTGVTWQQLQSSSDYGIGVTLDGEIWVGIVGPGASGNILVTLSAVPSFSAIADVFEFSGLAVTNFLDQIASNSNTVPNNQTDTGTTPPTTQDAELWFGVTISSDDSIQTTPTNGFTLYDGADFDHNVTLAILIKIVNVIGTANSGTSFTNSNFWVGAIVTIKAATIAVTQQFYGDGLTSYTC